MTKPRLNHRDHFINFTMRTTHTNFKVRKPCEDAAVSMSKWDNANGKIVQTSKNATHLCRASFLSIGQWSILHPGLTERCVEKFCGGRYDVEIQLPLRNVSSGSQGEITSGIERSDKCFAKSRWFDRPFKLLVRCQRNRRDNPCIINFWKLVPKIEFSAVVRN
jgi:hypothetical protein